MIKLFYGVIISAVLNILLVIWGGFFDLIGSEYVVLISLSISYCIMRAVSFDSFGQIWRCGVLYFDILIVASFLIILYALQFNELGSIRYGSVDPAGHFNMCNTYSINGVTLNYKQSELMNYSNYPMGYYVNCGLLIDAIGLSHFLEKHVVFSVFNYFIYFLLCFALLVFFQIVNVGAAIKRMVLFFLISGVLATLLLEGFFSQLLGLVFLLSYFHISAIKFLKANPSKSLEFIRLLLIVGVFLTYQYYILIIALIEIMMLFNGQIKWQYLTVSSVVSVFLVSPVIPLYFSTLGYIKADGGNYRDLVLNMIVLLPGLINIIRTPICELHRFIKMATGCIISIFILNLTFVFALGFSPYYLYKYYPVMMIMLGVNFLVYYSDIKHAGVKVKGIRYSISEINCLNYSSHIRIKLTVLIIIVLVFGFSSQISSKLAAKNNLAQLWVYKFLSAPPQLDVDKVKLFEMLKLINVDKESTCVTTNNDVQMIWFTQITNGIFFRGNYDANDAWSTPVAWNALYEDQWCKNNNYRYIVDYKCVSDSGIAVFENNAGCIFMNGK